ncbi:hypothetical protein B879_04225 [Cecembia lonarensis LW9]|uniref:Uncharacterized protein n=1 Tax=Cecembia lonarensis (strain CCUG 58316 / KCTC 22772 / LW9) TaxID=1225176 RepID=K1L575_CECL9|nr:hypothetical protein B879_04225 [Cecembia lonarensis LW9]
MRAARRRARAPERKAPAAMPARISPAPMGSAPHTLIRYNGSTSSSPNSPIATMAAVALPQVNVEYEKSERSSRVLCLCRDRRSSQPMNAARASRDTAPRTGIGDTTASAGHCHGPMSTVRRGLSQPQLGPSMSTKASNPNPSALNKTPSTSKPPRVFAVVVSGTKRRIPNRTNNPKGRLTQKIQRQSK